ncbi:MAG: GyrI-like domain-containing protein [Defluviitaleaceae bacterium]|nr:GyrI-like domain-containing protein [Defluviitaleaceae bacterium]
MEPRIAKLDKIECAGYLLKTSMTEVGANNPIPAFWGEIMADGRYQALRNIPRTPEAGCFGDYGVCIMLNDDDMDYVIAMALEDGVDVPSDWHRCTIPAGDYAVFETTLPNLGNTWGYSIEWMEKNGYTIAHYVSFEYYDERMSNPDPTQQTIDIYIPIIERKLKK